MPPKIYIDGQAGTTALRVRDWLAGRKDLEVVTLPEELRKDPAARKKALQDAAIVLLCLPDDASREAAEWLADFPVRILDASTAHRVTEGWTYGLPELLAGQREQIAKSQRVANPGCYASAVDFARAAAWSTPVYFLRTRRSPFTRSPVTRAVAVP